MTKIHTKPPYRADHVGSLIRPEPLLVARKKIHQGRNGSRRADGA
jgi:methionine synthase II (cobalamin-independent)